VYHLVEARIRAALREFLSRRGIQDIAVVTQRPPNVAMGEVATPMAFELAKRLRRAPRQIAQEIASELVAIPGVARVELAGGGYVNFFLDRPEFFEAAFSEAAKAGRGWLPKADAADPKCVVEHTNINPNKAAHIGHLRNAALGDTFVRLLRRAGRRVEVQNYIDNTGVQVADVVVGFAELEKKSPDEVRALAAELRFDYFCWDLYARVTQFFEEDKTRLALRAQTLAAIEAGHGVAAELAEIISVAIVRCHLATMERLGVQYDLLPRESEILHLKFWDAAFQKLKERGAIRLASVGKNAGCWVMTLAEKPQGLPQPPQPAHDRGGLRTPAAPKPSELQSKHQERGSPAVGDSDDDAKVIVRSNGTVTYVGKDIAYQLWKFGLLGRDFAYRRFHTYPNGHTVWTSTAESGEQGAPEFGHAADVYNVIDARQAFLQNLVVAGLSALGFQEQAERSVHFSYDVVALSPRCAAEMGYTLSEEEMRKPYVEVSGRKGLGVKADDLVDELEAAARVEVDTRHADTPQAERARIAHAIAIGALRYFLLKYTRTTIIAFDFRDALSFEGETGPYCQYAAVRARNIFRKLAEQEEDFSLARLDAPGDEASLQELLKSGEGDDFWELALAAGSLDAQVATALSAQEPAFMAKYAFELAQAFNLFYHRHHILSESNATKKTFLLRLSRLVERQLVTALDLLGIEAPEKM
jgi:arginyl-tRNA synthetase